MSLLDELRDAWPPDEPRPTGGYVHPRLAEATPLAATSLAPHAERGLGVVVASRSDGRLLLAPLVRDEARWRRARPRDGASAALIAALDSGLGLEPGFGLRRIRHTGELRGERAIGVEQTNESVVVGTAAVVKWLADPILREPGVPDLQAHLAELGFQGIPAPIGGLDWSDASGRTASLAFVTTWIAASSDGWDWCVEDVLAHVLHAPTGCDGACEGMLIPGRLGRASAALHVAMATPSRLIPEPVRMAGRSDVGGWQRSAEGALDEALDALTGAAEAEVHRHAEALRERIRSLGGVPSTPALRIHGDLHVGQVLRSPAGLWIIDLDDDVSLPAAERGRPLPAARDLVQLANSFDHVGRMVDRRTDHRLSDHVDGWVASARGSLFEAYTHGLEAVGRADLLDERMLAPFEAERVCREILYAARILPRWMYAPLGTLRRMFPG